MTDDKKKMKVLIVFMLLLLLTGCSSDSDQTQNQSEKGSVFVSWKDAGLEDHVMDWQDENLEAAMKEAVGIQGRDIMLSDAWEYTKLDLVHSNISDISALSGLTDLGALYLNNNNISDISALDGLRISELEIAGNPVSDQ